MPELKEPKAKVKTNVELKVDIIRDHLKRLDGTTLNIDSREISIVYRKRKNYWPPLDPVHGENCREDVAFVAVVKMPPKTDIYDPELLNKVLLKLAPEGLPPDGIDRFHLGEGDLFSPRILDLGRLYFKEVVGSVSVKHEEVTTIFDPKILSELKRSSTIEGKKFPGNVTRKADNHECSLIRRITIELYPDDFNAGRRSLQINVKQPYARGIGSS